MNAVQVFLGAPVRYNIEGLPPCTRARLQLPLAFETSHTHKPWALAVWPSAVLQPLALVFKEL